MNLRVGIGIPNPAEQVGALSFLPNSIPNCREWFRADRGVTSSGGLVSKWTNQADTTHLASVDAAGAARPTLTGGVPSLNNQAAILFDGVGTRLFGAGTTQVQPATTLLVFRMGLVGGLRFIVDGDGTGGRWTVLENADGTLESASGSALTTTALSAATPYYITTEWNGASGRVLINGTQNIAGNIGAGSLDGLTLGAAKPPTAIFFFDGHIAEWVVYGRILTAAELSKLHTYASAWYGI